MTVIEGQSACQGTSGDAENATKNSQNDEARARINVGWMTTPNDVIENLDTRVVEFSTALGKFQYSFVGYPIGGVVRSFWKYSRNEEPPLINLPDMQLQNHLWETYFSGQVSSWIDCDSKDEHLARLSEEELLKELNYVCYLGLRTIIVELKHVKSPRLASVLNRWVWTKHANFTIWVFVPTSVQTIGGELEDVWSVWADFRSQCANYCSLKLQVGIHITSDLDDEFTDKKFVDRWKAEPVGAMIIDSDAFITDPVTGVATLSQPHAVAIRGIWMNDSIRLLIRDVGSLSKHSNTLKMEYARAARNTVKDVSWIRSKAECSDYPDTNIDYTDILQAPLQPLADNLDSCVYNTFEQDPIKYQKYKEAVELALRDFGESSAHPNSVVVYVLGAGRGPLVSACYEAESAYNEKYRAKKDRLKIKMFVVEKNTNAVVTLRYMNVKAWKERARIVESDMRSLPQKSIELGLDQPDIIVSELLGSFGDNELSPECLDGVTPFLKPTTISIPQKYTSYAAPIMSLNMYQTILSTSPNFWNRGICGHGRDGPELTSRGSFLQRYPQGSDVSNLDQIYVVYLRQFCPLALPKEVFSFEHPNFENVSNDRKALIEFDIDRPADIMGFAGYFDMVLYKDVMLSILPSTYSKGMISWFPAVIPLRDLLRVSNGDKIRFLIERKSDEHGVWYEWCVERQGANGEKEQTPLQNQNGQSYYMRQ
ncbi:unnamed protein product [Caenorhabditis auriculariae]|uniref:Protein arginine N-methyltransferase n=1 Tax=Caenorhabditis auriculariae TaxID=2777116 RepID=A0A8S1H3R4_9PELO|nr:unnamed protein product [Caenorhabditis auriculariae]